MALLPPTNLVGTYQNRVTNANILQVKLTWTPPVGSDPFQQYNIYRNDVLLASVDDLITQYLDEDMAKSMNYVSYYITTAVLTPTPAESAISTPLTNYSLQFEDLIERLRKLLMDSPVDPRVQRWSDDVLLECLNMAIGDVNTEPPMSSYSFENLPSGWQSLVLTRAKFEAMMARASIESAKEFNFSFGGVSVNIDRSAKYLAISTQEWNAYNDRLHKAKLASVMTSVAPLGILTSDLPFKIRTYAPRQYRVR